MVKKLFLLLLLINTACSSTSSLKQELPSVPAAWPTASPFKRAVINTPVLTAWWKQFHDENLNWLIDQTLKNSPDLYQAAARIDEARGLQKSAFATLFPTVTGEVSANRSRQNIFQPVVGNNYTASFDASYEIDFFGKARSTSHAMEMSTAAAQKDYDWLKLSLIAEITRTYLAIHSAEDHLLLAKKDLITQQDTFNLVKHRYQAGGASEFDVKRTALQINQSLAQIAAYHRQQQISTLALSTLTGLTAEILQQHLDIHHAAPKIDLTLILTAPADVIAYRPDIVAANLRFLQATSVKNAQAAAIFPTLSISSLFGLSKTVFVGPTTIWSINPSFALSLLDFGKIQGQIDAASAREVIAYENWRKAILQGLQDVETALVNITRLQEQRMALVHARDNAIAAVNLVKIRYRAGDASLLEVLDAQHQKIETTHELISIENDYVTSIIALYKSLGQY